MYGGSPRGCLFALELRAFLCLGLGLQLLIRNLGFLVLPDILALFILAFQDRLRHDRTIITLSLEKRQAIKTSDNISPRAKRTAENQKKILDYLKDNGRSGCAEIAGYIGLSAARTRAILSEMKEVEAIGKNRNRTYRIKQS